MLNPDQFWPHISTLDGRNLKTLELGRSFEVVAVNWDQVVISPAVSGKLRTIQRQVLEDAFTTLLDRRELTCQEIANEFSSYHAGYVAALLAALPDVAVCVKPIRLIYVGHQLFYLD